MESEVVADYQCDVGENPLWHPMEQRFYWTDITRGKLFRFDPAIGKHEECYSGAPVGGFTIQADGGLLLFMERGAIAKWHDGRLAYIVEEIPAEIDNRFNDVIADPFGRVFCGTINIETIMLPPEQRILGRLYRLDTDGSYHLILEGIGISNGMGFTLDRQHLYYTDSSVNHIYRFDYDEKSGALANQRVWLRTPEGAGAPDGMTVDAHDHIWSARWGDSAIYRYTPDGLEERRVELPAKLVTRPKGSEAVTRGKIA